MAYNNPSSVSEIIALIQFYSTKLNPDNLIANQGRGQRLLDLAIKLNALLEDQILHKTGPHDG
jgi:hypothetical protein